MIDRAHGGDIQEYRGEISSYSRKLIDFSANINPLGFSPKARAAIIRNIDGIIRYPQADSANLKKALGAFCNTDYHNIAVGNGSIELIYLIPKAFKIKKVLIITPTFSEYEFAAKLNGSKIVFLKTEEGDDFKLGLHKLKKLIPKVDLVFIGNPNNPIGAYILLEEMLSVIELCQQCGTFLAVDEVFMDFVETSDRDILASLVPRNKILIVLRSLTKFFALPGLRIGYAISHRDLVKRISELQYPWNINSLAQAVGEEVLEDRGYMNKSREYVVKEKEYLFGRLKNIKGLKTYPPSSNFILCKLEDCAIKSAQVLNEMLLEKGLVVRNCSNFRGLNERFFRVAVRKRAENLKLIMALKEVL